MEFNEITELLLPAIKDTFIMVIPSTILSVVFGFILAIILILSNKGGLKENKIVYKVLAFIVNVLRSFPFVILMVAIIPFTKAIAGTSIGNIAAIVPLTVAAIPFATRVIEGALKEVDKGIIEASQSFGANNFQIIFKVMLVEAYPRIISGITLTVINLIGYSAMAGTIGAGGLGDLAIRYGYQRFETKLMIITVIALIIIVQGLQYLGDYIYAKKS